jgi:hypothetical protein
MRPIALFLAAWWMAAAAMAQVGDNPGPPGTVPPGAQLTTMPVTFTDAAVGFTSADVSLPSLDLAPAPVADVAAPVDGLSVQEEEGGRLRFTLEHFKVAGVQ